MLDSLCSPTRLEIDFAGLGVEPGDVLLVHSSLSALGWVIGGAPTVVRSLIDRLGPNGTLVMPAATPLCADPADWPPPGIPEDCHDAVREHLPVFDPAVTPTTMGVIAETLRTWPGTVRSDHPLESVCARGPMAHRIVGKHSLAFCEGPGTPFEQVVNLDARVLLLGVGFNRCTLLHFAESQVANRRTEKSRYALMRDGKRVWVEVDDMAADRDRLFPQVGSAFLEAGRAVQGRVGNAEAVLFGARDLVAFATAHMEGLPG